MGPPAHKDYVAYQGVAWRRWFIPLDEAKQPIDPTGYQVWMEIRASPDLVDDTPLCLVTTESGGTGGCGVTIDAVNRRIYLLVGMAVTAGASIRTYYYDVKVLAPAVGSAPEIVLEGQWAVLAPVTRAGP